MFTTEVKDRAALFAEVAAYLETHYHEILLFAVEECSMPRPCAAAPKNLTFDKSLDELLRNTDAGFSETLLSCIDETGKKDSDIYKKVHISRQHFSKIRNNPNYRPQKCTALAFAIALELDLEKTQDLIGRAGYTLSNSSKFDVIVKYFIEKKHYDIDDINATLYEFDQSLLTDKNVT